MDNGWGARRSLLSRPFGPPSEVHSPAAPCPDHTLRDSLKARRAGYFSPSQVSFCSVVVVIIGTRAAFVNPSSRNFVALNQQIFFCVRHKNLSKRPLFISPVPQNPSCGDLCRCKGVPAGGIQRAILFRPPEPCVSPDAFSAGRSSACAGPPARPRLYPTRCAAPPALLRGQRWLPPSRPESRRYGQ